MLEDSIKISLTMVKAAQFCPRKKSLMKHDSLYRLPASVDLILSPRHYVKQINYTTKSAHNKYFTWTTY